jgi:phosphocarrier protein HPr
MTESTEFRQDEGREDEDCPPPPIHAGAHARDMRIVNRKGLHARATAKFVQCVDRFDAQVKVTRCGETVGGDSIMGILMLGAGLGSTITVSALGAQAVEALDALETLVANRFDEDE